MVTDSSTDSNLPAAEGSSGGVSEKGLGFRVCLVRASFELWVAYACALHSCKALGNASAIQTLVIIGLGFRGSGFRRFANHPPLLTPPIHLG